MVRSRSRIRRLVAPVRSLFVSDASAGVLLILVAIAAMIAANSPLSDEYRDLFYGYMFPKDVFKLNTLHLWINDGLMAIFFFVVGLEIKREIICGQLSSPEQRRLPVLAASAGMIAPALVYLFFIGGDAGLTRGWAIPAATDIAFAMGVIGLLGSRVPASLRLFLLTIAIVDDMGAVIIIAAFYGEYFNPFWFLMSVLLLAVMVGMNRFGVNRIWPFVLVAFALWFAVLFSGVHATIAGVLAALTIPMRSSNGSSLLERMEHSLAPWSAYLVVPIFGFANAGVDLSDMGLNEIFAPLPLAIATGLFVGKQLGIFGIVVGAVKLGIAKAPDNASWPEIWGVAVLCGIGFTMSLFIGELAFVGNRTLIDEAKIGILMGSIISAFLGYFILRLTTRHPEESDPQSEPA
ncbi:Na+/H+ antiporter NhaA [Qipengyuania sp. JC766]|uniref:Na+/H+ antiporter NhaA n=1 Tax=Qipengyuania sp. JC766 TaxID=3232139 RepID=UPI00345982D3